MPHRLLFLDFETYYDNEYSLKKMAPPNYILDPRWELIGCACKVDGEASHFVDGPDFAAYIAQFDPKTTTTVAFNALFDNCILAWHYGFVPARMLCTMRMAVALRGHVLSGASLAIVGKSLGLGVKGTTIQDAKGLRRAALIANPGLWRAYQAYANNDNELSAGILAHLWKEFPTGERRVMDKVIRMAVCPQFMVDVNMLRDHLADLKVEKIKALRLAAGMPPDNGTGALDLQDDTQLTAALDAFAKKVRSPAKFEELLIQHGVDIQYKPSTSDPSRQIPAFAKTDEFMSDLLEHEDPVIQALASARLGERSTIEEKRGARMLSIAELPWENHYRDGNAFWSQHSMPIPLRYSGAHTHRLSGDWLLNMQNLPAGRGTNHSKLRKALIASPGHKVVVGDLSQIECRINAYICGQYDLLNLFANGQDAYSVLASKIFGKPVDKKTDAGTPRFIGKSGELGLGFGCGDEKFYNMVVRSARVLGMDVKKLLTVWTQDLAAHSVNVYRASHQPIVQAWRTLDSHLRTVWMGQTLPVRFGPVLIGPGSVEGPGGLTMKYGNPRQEEGEYWFDYGRRKHKIYGSKFLENIVQFLARIVIMNAALRIGDRTHIDFALQSHDELAWIVPDAAVQDFITLVKQELVRRPSWAPTIPLDCEVGFGQSYGDAK
jgi:DNA polymerase